MAETKNPAMTNPAQPASPRAGMTIGGEPNYTADGASGRTHADDPQPENKRDQSGDQMVKVKARRTFHKEANMQGDMVHEGDEFETHRSRAAELRANGLIEYGNEEDEKKAHGNTDGDRIKSRIEMDNEMRKIPENSKSSPLRNPEIKFAEPNGDVRKDKDNKDKK